MKSAPRKSAQAGSKAQRLRLEREKAELERQRALVAAKAERHLARLGLGKGQGSPWDDDFIQDVRGLLDRGLEDRALTVALAVTTAVVSWRFPEQTLMLCLEQATGPVAADAKTDRKFMAFVRGQLIPAHRRWATGMQQRERARLTAQGPAIANDREAETRRQDATALRRPIAKRY